LDNDGYIGKEELRKMFKAYFYLSMELVRDVVRALEEEMMESFDEEASKPVSAAFTAPIPHRTASSQQTKVANDGDPAHYFPVMETMSQDAIDEMVEKTFSGLDPTGQGVISFDAFRVHVENDPTMLAWFEALGFFCYYWRWYVDFRNCILSFAHDNNNELFSIHAFCVVVLVLCCILYCD
jgi:hypothetical protein